MTESPLTRMTSGSYTISPARPNDAEGVYDVMRATWLDTYPNEEHGISHEDIRARIEGEHAELIAQKIEKWRETIKNPSRTIIVAKDGDKVVGYVAPFYDENEKHYRVGGLYVLPETQGKGVGHKLIQESIASIGREHDIYLHVVTYNRKAIGFYERQGFVKTGRDTTGSTRGLKDGRLIPEIEMVLRATN